MTILNTYTTSIPIILYIIGMILFGGFIFILAYAEDRSVALGLICASLAITVITIICIFGGAFNYHVRIEATIDDTVSFNEIYEKYKVIDKDGLIYTLEKKDDE